jgi:hypothetical protein
MNTKRDLARNHLPRYCFAQTLGVYSEIKNIHTHTHTHEQAIDPSGRLFITGRLCIRWYICICIARDYHHSHQKLVDIWILFNKTVRTYYTERAHTNINNTRGKNRKTKKCCTTLQLCYTLISSAVPSRPRYSLLFLHVWYALLCMLGAYVCILIFVPLREFENQRQKTRRFSCPPTITSAPPVKHS